MWRLLCRSHDGQLGSQAPIMRWFNVTKSGPEVFDLLDSDLDVHEAIECDVETADFNRLFLIVTEVENFDTVDQQRVFTLQCSLNSLLGTKGTNCLLSKTHTAEKHLQDFEANH